MKRDRQKWIFLVMAFLLFCFLCQIFHPSCNAFARDKIAMVSTFTGELEIIRKGKHIPVEPGMSLFSWDRIKTRQGTAEVDLLDGSLLRVRAESHLMLEQTWKRTRTMGGWTKELTGRIVEVKRGEVWGDIKAHKGLKTVFKSAAVVATVKGTTVTINVDDQGRTTLTTEEGQLSVTSMDGRVTFTLSTGESIGVYIDPATGAASIESYAGTIEVRAGNATIILEKGEAISAYQDPETGITTMVATKGDVKITCEEETVTVPEGFETTCAPGEGPTELSTPAGAPPDPGLLVPPPPISLPPPPPPPPPSVASPAS